MCVCVIIEKLTLTNGGQHNYASIDCGAKIIASNKETQVIIANDDVIMM